MFSNALSLMLYVKNVKKSVDFWQEIGFSIISQEEIDGSLTAEIKPSKDSDVTITLYDLAFILENSPEVATNSPSILFQSDEIENLYHKLKAVGYSVGELIQLPSGLVFNFADPDGNYFAVQESVK